MLTPKQLEQMEYETFQKMVKARSHVRITGDGVEEYRATRHAWLDANMALELDTAARARMAPNKEGTC